MNKETKLRQQQERGRFDEITIMKLVLAVVACGTCLVLTVLFAGWFVYVFGPAGAVLALIGAFLTIVRSEDRSRLGTTLLWVGGVLVSGPLIYLVLLLIDKVNR